MTFSIAARCVDTGMLGVAVTSSSLAVAARCAFVQAGVGAALTQNLTDPTLGPRALALMAQGASATQARDVLAGGRQGREDPRMGRRQLALVDAAGGSATFTGARVASTNADCAQKDVACAGNLLADTAVAPAMLAAFVGAAGPLGDRLLTALRAGLAAGGETQPVRSAGLMLADTAPFPVADLRVDWTDDGDCPIARLAALWDLYAPQMGDYVLRALDPDAAPPYAHTPTTGASAPSSAG